MNTLTPGFATPLQAQACFRAVLKAMSFPGAPVELPGVAEPPAALSPAAAAILLTLADTMVTVSLPPGAEGADWLAFHTGAKTAPAADADFVVARARPALSTLRLGTYDEPEMGATLILDVPDLDAGPRFRLTGPGIAHETLRRLPLDDQFLPEWRALAAKTPLGVDILLCAGTTLIGLPRSLTMELL